MGAQTPPRSPSEARLEALIDHFEFSFPDGIDPRAVLAGWSSLQWHEVPRGRLGYSRAVESGKLRIDFDGAPGMGSHATISGQGCREAEALDVVRDGMASSPRTRVERYGEVKVTNGTDVHDVTPDWPGFFRTILAAGGHATRLDLALDDRAGRLDLDRMWSAWQAGHATSPWDDCDPRQPTRKGHAAALQTLYFGDPKSATRARIYDKAHQLGLPAGTHYIRAELQLRRDRANRAMQCLAERRPEEIGRFIAGLWKRYLRFVEPTVSRVERCPTARWWAAFLGDVESVRLGSRPQLQTVEAATWWVQRYVAPWLAVIEQYRQGTLDKFVADAGPRLTQRHLAILAAARAGAA